MRRVFAEHFALLFDPQLWGDNPFRTRDARRDARHNQSWNTLIWLCITLFFFGLIFFESIAIQYQIWHSNSHMMGGDIAIDSAIMLSGIHIWFIVRAGQRYAVRMLAREVSQDQMIGLLMLPSDRFRILAQASVYPWFAAMRIAVALLPAYVFLTTLNGPTWQDLFGLYIVFALAGVSLPVWRRPALSAEIGIVSSTQSTPGIEFEATWSGVLKRLFRQAMMGGWIVGIGMFFLFVFLAYQTRDPDTLERLETYIPRSVLLLMPYFIVSWPLLLARILVTPFNWFGTPLAPLPFVVMGFLLYRYLQLAHTAEFLSVGAYRELATLPSYLPRRRMELALNGATTLFVTGYLWRWAVIDGGLTSLTGRTIVNAQSGLAGFALLLSFLVAVWGVGRAGALGEWLHLKRFRPAEGALRQFSARSALRFLAEPFGLGLGFYLLCCLFSGTTPFPTEVVTPVSTALLVALSGMAFYFGARFLMGSYAQVCLLLVPLAIWGPPVFRQTQLLCLAFLGSGLAFALGAALLPGSKERAQYETAASPLDSTRFGDEVFRDFQTERKTINAQRDSPLTLAFISALEKAYDNAITTKELRTRLRGRLSVPTVELLFVAMLVVSLVAGLILPGFASMGSGMAELLFGPLPAYTFPDLFANILGVWYIALLCVAYSSGYSILPRVFDQEREKSTLGFLLATPMNASSIAFGKLVGLTLTDGLAVWMIGLWTLAMSLPLAILLRSPGVFLGWAEVMLTAVTLQVTVGAIMLAMGSMFPRLTMIRFNGCLRIIVLLMLIQIISLFWSIIFVILKFLDWSDFTFWLAFLGICALVTAFALLLAVSAISGMRRRDVALAPQIRR